MKHVHLSRSLEVQGISLRELARRCGTSASTMMRVRDRTVVPSRRVLDAIHRETAGAVSVAELILVSGSAPSGTAPRGLEGSGRFGSTIMDAHATGQENEHG